MTRAGRLGVALALNVVLVGAQVAFGLAAHSLGLLADAGHNLSDVAAVVVSLVAVQWARRAPTVERSYGYHRGTILAALQQAGEQAKPARVRQQPEHLGQLTDHVGPRQGRLHGAHPLGVDELQLAALHGDRLGHARPPVGFEGGHEPVTTPFVPAM